MLVHEAECAHCGIGFVSLSRQALYCSSRCKGKARWARDKEKKELLERREEKRRLRRKDRRGRQCKHCLALDSEASFVSQRECTACARARQRCGLCRECGVILGGSAKDDSGLCVGCRPDKGQHVKVFLLEDGGLLRSRVVWRKKTTRDRVSIRDLDIKIMQDPVVVALPTEDWVTVRR